MINKKKSNKLSKKNKKKGSIINLNKANCNTLNKIIYNNTILGSGRGGLIYLGCNDNCNYKIGVKIISLPNKYLLNDYHPGIVDYLIGNELTQLKIPHINRVYKSIECNLTDIYKKNIIEKQYIEVMLNELNDGNIYNTVKIIFNEYANTDLHKYLKTNSLSLKEHKILLFCFCYTLTCIQYKLPNYRHNDIKPNNILIKLNKTKINSNDYKSYKIFGKTYYIPNQNFDIKLHDFDFSNCKKYPNQKILEYKNNAFKKIGTTPEINPVYDLHLYANSMLKFLKDYFTPEIIEFYESLITEDTIGEGDDTNDSYIFKYKLTKYHHNNNVNESNFIHPDIESPAGLLYYSKIFDIFTEPPKPYNLTHKYNSKININPRILKRADMFNQYKHKNN